MFNCVIKLAPSVGQALDSRPFSKLGVSLEHFPQDCPSACVHCIIENLPALRRSDIEYGVHCRLQRLSDWSCHPSFQLQLDILHQNHVHVFSGGALRCVSSGAQGALLLATRDSSNCGLANEGNDTPIRMGECGLCFRPFVFHCIGCCYERAEKCL